MVVIESLDIPIATNLDLAFSSEQPVPGFQLSDMSINRPRREKIAERQVSFQTPEIERPVPGWTVLHRLDLTREVQDALQLRKKQRLLPNPIASEEQLAPHL